MTAQAAEQESPIPDWRAGAESTLQHLALLKRKEERLRAARAAAEDQLIHAAASAYAAGQTDLMGLFGVYAELVEVGVMVTVKGAQGWRKRWDSRMPREASTGSIKYAPEMAARHTPNGPFGSWQGAKDGPYVVPPRGTCVAYVLFDAANVPCYVGSSENFEARLKNHWSHTKDIKEFARWEAYPANGDREAAYALETRLLAEHKPYLNKKAGR